MDIVFKFFRLILKLIIIVLVLLIIVVSVEYVSCPVYIFETGKTFHGDKIYNPYQNLEKGNWHKANFQVQSYAWGGVTSGRGNTNESIYELYQKLGYDIIAISDYQRINTWASKKTGYIPVYEHGYSIHKQHQVLLGSERVLWKDYTVFQTLSNKQHIINGLRPDNQLVYIAHPKLRGGYSIDDFRKLNNYDGIEVLNNHSPSVPHWDAALSAGNYVTILSDDDAHDISNPDEIGHHCTFINCKSLDQQEILKSLKAGNSFGARISRPKGESFEIKIAKAKNLPVLEKVEVKNDQLYIKLDSTAKEIRFIGQDGNIITILRNVKQGTYTIKPTDTYIRAEIQFEDYTTYFLNPICRYDGVQPAKLPLARIDWSATWILRIVGFATLLFIVLNVVIFRFKYLRKKTP